MKSQKYFYCYVIAACCFGIQAVGIGAYVTFGVFFSPIISEFGWSRATLSGASSLAFFLMGLLGIYVGRLNDRIGPRKMMTASAIVFGLGHLLMSRAGSVWQLYLFWGVVVGVGLSSIDVIALTSVARWFDLKRGLMTGIVKVGTGAGQFSIPLLASLLIGAYGWRTSYLILGTAYMIALVIIAQLMRRDPTMIGLPLDWETAGRADRQVSVQRGLTREAALRTREFWTICAANLVVVFCLMLVMVHIVPHALDLGFSATKAAGVLSTIGGVSMVGRFVAGVSIDRMGSKRVMIISFILLLGGLLWIQTARQLWMLFLFATIYGLAHGSFFTSISTLVAEFFGIHAHGALFGIVAFCGAFGGAVGPVTAGYIFDKVGTYSPAFWLCILMSAIGFVLILILKPVSLPEMDAV